MNPVLALLFATGLLVGPERPAAAIAREQLSVIEYMLSETPADGTHVFWRPCGQENAYYSLPNGPIELCLELNDTPAAVFAAAHEAGHALVYQLSLPIDDDAQADERAADELAAIFLIEMGKMDEVAGGAKWFMEDPDRRPDGVHPAHRLRAWELLCIMSGSEKTGSPECQILYHAVWMRWAQAIELALR